MAKINTASGGLTAYGLACGYEQRKGARIGGAVRLWQENGAYHVRVHVPGVGRVLWEVFANLGDARRLYGAL